MSKKDEALKLALEALEEAWYHVGTFQPTEKAIDLYDEARTAIKEALSSCQCPECRLVLHTSDCAVHNKPAYPKGACNCGAQPEQEPVAWEDVLGAIARGWAHPENARKPMDVQLAVAIAKEIQDMYTTPPAAQPEQRKPLTDKQILADETLRYYFGQNGGAGPVSKQGRKVVDAIEAAHGIKETKK